MEAVAATLPQPLDLSIIGDYVYVLSADTRPSIYLYRIVNLHTCALEQFGRVDEGLPPSYITENGVVGLTV